MNVTLKNTSRFGFWVTLSDGSSIDLSPRTKPVSVPQRELIVNRSLKKLMDRGLVEEIKEPGRAKEAKEPGRAKEAKEAGPAEEAKDKGPAKKVKAPPKKTATGQTLGIKTRKSAKAKKE